MDVLLAYDVGTSGAKAALLRLDGQVLATATAPYPVHYPAPGRAEQDPADWLRAVGHTTRRVLQASGVHPRQVQGLACSTQMLNVVCLDRAGQPIGPAISWLDSRAAVEARQVMRLLGGPKVFAQLVGASLTGKDLLPKYLWLKRHQPERYTGATALVDCSGYLLRQLTGRLAYEWSCASVTGVFSLKSKTWDGLLMRLFGLDGAKFPPLVGSTERVGGLTPSAAASLGLLTGTPVFGGAGDAMTAAVGAGAVGEGDGHLCLGTSGFAGVITRRRVTGRRGMATVQSADPDKLLLVGVTETAAACLRWAAAELYDAANDPTVYSRMDGDVASTPAGAGRLIFTPWMYGERCPIADETLRAAFINLSASHTRAQMTRAVYEGVAYNLRFILESIDELYQFRPDPLRVIGGGARGLPWLRILADVIGRTLEAAPFPQEAGAVGAGLLAAVGLGVYPSVEAVKTIVAPAQIVRPNPATRPLYDELYAVFRQVYPALRGLYTQLNPISL